MARRLSTDAKIVLERAGYVVKIGKDVLFVSDNSTAIYPLQVKGGTVSNLQVVELLARKEFNEFGWK